MAEHCPFDLCDGDGFVYDEAERVSRPCRCRPARQASRRSRSLSHKIPARYRGNGFDRHPVTDMDPTIVRAVRRYADTVTDHAGRGDGLWLYGSRGTGKTTLTMLVAEAAMRARLSVAIYTAPQLLAEIQSTYAADASESYLGLMEKLAAVDVLHVEDLAVARQSDWMLEQLYAIVNRRYEDRRAMVITADVTSPEQLGEHIGDRTYSRLVEMCGDDGILPLMGSDKRIRV